MIRHKDVKCDNILMHGGKVFLADFGSSWDGYAQGSMDTHNEVPKGHTARYASTEVITKEPRSAKSDVFSLGGVFYEIFCALEVSFAGRNTE
jgi:serine/threonine protein kinase